MSSAKVSPHSFENEESVLGAILIDNKCIDSAIELLDVEDFYKPANQEIFDAMIELHNRRDPIDIISLNETLSSRNSIDKCGGVDYLNKLSSQLPSPSNIAFYAKIVRNMSIRRKLIKTCSQIVGESFQTDTDLEDFLNSAEKRMLEVSQAHSSQGFIAVEDLVTDSIKTIEERFNRKDAITGTSTGFTDLDSLTGGLQDSNLIVVAARPAMGKTSLAMSLIQNITIGTDQAAAIFSLEMSKEELVLRLLCSEARINNKKIQTGSIEEQDFPKIVPAAEEISKAKIFIDDTPALTISALNAKARRLHREHPLSLIVVDYLQYMRSPAYSKNREQEIADISRSLKALAKELKIPIIALAQLNRSVEARDNKRPLMSDLRESGSIEQDADIIMFIYRDEVYNPENVENHNTAELIISKHRSGPTGVVKVGFVKEYTRFENLARNDDYDTAGTTVIDLDLNTGDNDGLADLDSEDLL